ncbi:cation acetate symporter [Nonomuraea sp. NPDC059007]|uniref:solute symporter family protein n=1 Tax=Nonomuraea sp. NPDC059007 TaxID=3346692 RepID=UPI0036C4DFA4
MTTALISAALLILVAGVVVAARRGQTSPAEFYVAGRRIGPGQNALALFASFVLLSTMFTMTGHVALNGFDALLFSAAFVMSWLIALLIFASPLRNIRGQTLGDLFALRVGERTARTASIVVTLVLYTTYAIVMMEAGGIVSRVMFGLDAGAGRAVVVAGMGVLATVFVLVGGMRGTTRLLVVKAALIIGVLAVLTAVVLVKYRFNLFQLLGDAQAKAAPHPAGFDLLGPGREFSEGGGPIGHLSKLFVAFVGHAALPYMFMRNAAVTSGRDARRSVGWAGLLMAGFYLCVAVVGLGAVALLGGLNIGVAPPTRDTTLPILANAVGGPWLVGLAGALALIIVVGMLATLLISAVTSVTRDVFAMRQEPQDPGAEVKAARRNTVVIGLATAVVGTVLLQASIHALLPMTISLAAASVLPAVVYSLFWKRFNSAGLRWSVYGGLIVTGVLAVFSGLVTGSPVAIFQGINIAFITFDPALASVPITFLLGYVGTITSRERNEAGFAELQVRAFTGAGESAAHATPPAQVGHTPTEAR